MVRFWCSFYFAQGSVLLQEEQWPTDAGAARKLLLKRNKIAAQSLMPLFLFAKEEGSNFADALKLS